uniref:Uncharacterized protein n=1 Tax=Anguilla anguilla TaxID=7936 RepID=A0A0E9UUA0_ANGAN
MVIKTVPKLYKTTMKMCLERV